MLNFTLQPKEKILIVMPEGKLEADDFARLATAVDPYLRDQGELNGLLIEAETFPGWTDFAAFLAHLQFVRGHHKQIRKVAAVTNSGFLAIMPKVASHFVQAEVKHFPVEERQSALAWLKAD